MPPPFGSRRSPGCSGGGALWCISFGSAKKKGCVLGKVGFRGRFEALGWALEAEFGAEFGTGFWRRD